MGFPNWKYRPANSRKRAYTQPPRSHRGDNDFVLARCNKQKKKKQGIWLSKSNCEKMNAFCMRAFYFQCIIFVFIWYAELVFFSVSSLLFLFAIQTCYLQLSRFDSFSSVLLPPECPARHQTQPTNISQMNTNTQWVVRCRDPHSTIHLTSAESHLFNASLSPECISNGVWCMISASDKCEQ